MTAVAWDPTKHPRHPAGDERGGEFSSEPGAITSAEDAQTEGGRAFLSFDQPYRRGESINAWWNPNANRGGTGGDWELKTSDQWRRIDPSEPHVYADLWPEVYQSWNERFGDEPVLNDTSPPNPRGAADYVKKWIVGRGNRDSFPWFTELRTEYAKQMGLPDPGITRNWAPSEGRPPLPFELREATANFIETLPKAPATQPALWRGLGDVRDDWARTVAAAKPGDTLNMLPASYSRSLVKAEQYAYTGREPAVMLHVLPGSRGLADKRPWLHDEEVISAGEYEVVGNELVLPVAEIEKRPVTDTTHPTHVVTVRQKSVRPGMSASAWNESAHPRHPAGSERGGEFAPAGPGYPSNDLVGRLRADDANYDHVLKAIGEQRYPRERPSFEQAVAVSLWYDPPGFGEDLRGQLREGVLPEGVPVDPAAAGWSTMLNQFENQAVQRGDSTIRNWGDVYHELDAAAKPLSAQATVLRGTVAATVPEVGDTVEFKIPTSVTTDTETADAFALRMPPPAAMSSLGSNPAEQEAAEAELEQLGPRGLLEPGEKAIRWRLSLPVGTRVTRGGDDLREFILAPGYRAHVTGVSRPDRDEEVDAVVDAVVEPATLSAAASWDPTTHPRHPAGSPQGGEFSAKSDREFMGRIREALVTGFPKGEFTPSDSVKFWPREIGEYSGYNPRLEGPFWKALANILTGEELAFWFVDRDGFPHHAQMRAALDLPTDTIYNQVSGYGDTVLQTAKGIFSEETEAAAEDAAYAMVRRHRRDIRDAEEMVEGARERALAASGALNLETEALMKAFARLQRQYEKVYRRAAKRAAADYRAAMAVVHADATPDEIVKAAALVESFRRLTAASRRAMLGEILDALKLLHEATAQEGDDQGADAIELYLELLQEQTGVQAERLVAGAQDAAASIMLDSLAQGWTVPQTAAALQAKLESIAPWQATMLARTDLIALANGASVQRAVVLNDPQSAYKTWLATPDERTRINHRHAHGQTVPVQQPFTVGGEQLLYPGDPSASDGNVINCRCTVIYGPTPFGPEGVRQIAMLPDLAVSAAGWEEREHPRHAKGTEDGGKFAPKLRGQALIEEIGRQRAERAAKLGRVAPEYDPVLKGMWSADGDEFIYEADDPFYSTPVWKAIKLPDGSWKFWITNKNGQPHHDAVLRRLGYPTTIGGLYSGDSLRTGSDENGNPLNPELQEVLLRHRSKYEQAAERASRALAAAAWDESAHPRHPKGSPQGGEFAPGDIVSGRAMVGGREIKGEVVGLSRFGPIVLTERGEELTVKENTARHEGDSGLGSHDSLEGGGPYPDEIAGLSDELSRRWPETLGAGDFQLREKYERAALAQLRSDMTRWDLSSWQERAAAMNEPWYQRLKLFKDTWRAQPEDVLLRGVEGDPGWQKGDTVDLPLSDFTTDAGTAEGYGDITLELRSERAFPSQALESDPTPMSRWIAGGRMQVLDRDGSRIILVMAEDPLTAAVSTEAMLEHHRTLARGRAFGHAFIEAEHPRHPAGTEQGGEFAPKGAVVDWSEAQAGFGEWAGEMAKYYTEEEGYPPGYWEQERKKAWLAYRSAVNTQLPALQARLNGAQVPGVKIQPQLNPQHDGDMDVILDPERLPDYGPDFQVELPAAEGGLPPDFTVWTYAEGANKRHADDPDWHPVPEGVEVEDVLDITDTDFFPDGPDSDLAGDYARAVDAARGVPDEPGYVTIYRGMSDAEYDAWQRGDEIPMGKFFAGIPTVQYAQDRSGEPPQLYTFRAPRSMLMQTGPNEYQLKKRGRMGKPGELEPSQLVQAAALPSHWQAVVDAISAAAFVEAQHPRHPAGSERGGEFAARGEAVPVAIGDTLDDVLHEMGADVRYYPRLVHADEQGRPVVSEKQQYTLSPDPATTQPIEFAFRAISEEEWENALRNGYLKSDGRMNLAAGEGTVAALDDPSFYLPGKLASDKPGRYEARIVKIKLGEGWRLDRDGYVKTNKEIPLDEVAMVSPKLVGEREVRLTRGGQEVPLLPSFQPLRAAAVTYDGAGGMVCLYPKPEEAEAIARVNGQPPEDLHVTLLYYEDGVPGEAEDAIRELGFEGLKGEITGIARFQAGEDGVPVVGIVSAVGLNELRAELADRLPGYSERHGFVPHLTLGYDQGEDPLVEDPEGAVGLPVTFSTVSVKNKGDERQDITAASWDEAEHPREPAGTEKGGEFASRLERALANHSMALQGSQELQDAAASIMAGQEGEGPAHDAAKTLMSAAQEGIDQYEGIVYRGSTWATRANPKEGQIIEAPLWSFTPRREVALNFSESAAHRGGGRKIIYWLYNPKGIDVNKRVDTVFNDEVEFLVSGKYRVVYPERVKESFGWKEEPVLKVGLEPVEEPVAAAAWDETAHPRWPAGDERGGEFAPKGAMLASDARVGLQKDGTYRLSKAPNLRDWLSVAMGGEASDILNDWPNLSAEQASRLRRLLENPAIQETLGQRGYGKERQEMNWVLRDLGNEPVQQTATPVAGPTRSVLDKLEIGGGQNAKNMLEGAQMVDKTIRYPIVPGEPKIRIEGGRKSNRKNATFWRRGATMRPSHIVVYGVTDNPVSSVVHELGHYLDSLLGQDEWASKVTMTPQEAEDLQAERLSLLRSRGGIEDYDRISQIEQELEVKGPKTFWNDYSSKRSTGTLQPVMAAIKETEMYKKLEQSVSAGKLGGPVFEYGGRRFAPGSQHARYLLKPEESIARSFEQYVASKHPDSNMARSPRHVYSQSTYGYPEYPGYMKGADLERVNQAWDEVLEQRGLLKVPKGTPEPRTPPPEPPAARSFRTPYERRLSEREQGQRNVMREIERILR